MPTITRSSLGGKINTQIFLSPVVTPSSEVVFSQTKPDGCRQAHNSNTLFHLSSHPHPLHQRFGSLWLHQTQPDNRIIADNLTTKNICFICGPSLIPLHCRSFSSDWARPNRIVADKLTQSYSFPDLPRKTTPKCVHCNSSFAEPKSIFHITHTYCRPTLYPSLYPSM